MSVIRSPLYSPLRSPLRSPLALLKGGGGTTWAKWIEGLTPSQVLDIDFAQTDRHYQDTAGQALADDAGEAIALAMDSGAWGGLSLSAVAAAQTERVANGGFKTDLSGWTQVVADSGVISWAAGAASINNTSGSGNTGIYQGIAVPAGSWMRVAYDASGTFPRTGWFDGASFTTLRAAIDGAGAKSGLVGPINSGSMRAWMHANAGQTAVYDNISGRQVPGQPGVQATANLQGKRQSGGVCRYDGVDDKHLTAFLAQSGAMTLLYHGTIDATISATQMFLGASGSSANRCWLAVTTAGMIAAGVGSESTSTIVGTTDVRGKTIVAALTFDGSTVKLFLRVDGATAVEYSAAQAGTPTTTIPFRLGAYNNNGTAAGFAKVDAKRLGAAHKVMTIAEFTSIAAGLAA